MPFDRDEYERNLPYKVTSRKLVMEGKDMFVKEFTLAPREVVPWHHHTQVSDVFYCVEGDLEIELKDVFTGEARQALRLKVGDSAKVDPGTAHQPTNVGSGVCRFLLIQGVGEYDYVPFRT